LRGSNTLWTLAIQFLRGSGPQDPHRIDAYAVIWVVGMSRFIHLHESPHIDVKTQTQIKSK